jgi:hypothetical protein
MTDTLYPDPPRGSYLPGAAPDSIADNPPDPGSVEEPEPEPAPYGWDRIEGAPEPAARRHLFDVWTYFQCRVVKGACVPEPAAAPPPDDPDIDY